MLMLAHCQAVQHHLLCLWCALRGCATSAQVRVQSALRAAALCVADTAAVRAAVVLLCVSLACPGVRVASTTGEEVCIRRTPDMDKLKKELKVSSSSSRVLFRVCAGESCQRSCACNPSSLLAKQEFSYAVERAHVISTAPSLDHPACCPQ